jgi:putative tryptophan/tyrosine transport system substrate-binding protein
MRRPLRLWLAVVLILSASAVLLTDRERPRGGAGSSGPGPAARIRSISLFQHVSQATLEEGARGVLAGLAQKGYQEEGETISVHRFSAEGDVATSNAIARAIIGGDDELVVTLSTPSLQALAAANRDSKRPHVFGMVSDPVAAGVGISREGPRNHPRLTS